jgi:RNA polymerase sigma-70 factor (ECF subfamily)
VSYIECSSIAVILIASSIGSERPTGCAATKYREKTLTPRERQQKVEELFRQYGRGVGSFIMARVGNADLAETITSNVFFIVVRQIEQCRSAPGAWLWSIVRSELARHFRRHKAADQLTDRFADPALAPPELAARNEMQERMQIALHRLGDEQQRIIYLKFFLDVPNTEIAAELGLSSSNIGVIVHRAVKQLRELMEEKTRAANPGRVMPDTMEASRK